LQSVKNMYERKLLFSIDLSDLYVYREASNKQWLIKKETKLLTYRFADHNHTTSGQDDCTL
jgi:hypothetical protein